MKVKFNWRKGLLFCAGYFVYLLLFSLISVRYLNLKTPVWEVVFISFLIPLFILFSLELDEGKIT